LKKRKAGGRAGKRKGVQPRSVARSSDGMTLRESEARFRGLVENTAAPIGITNVTGELTYVNKALADLTGYSIQELVSHPFMQFLHPEDREMALRAFKREPSIMEEAQELEFRIIRRDGQILTLTSKPTQFEIAGKTVGFQAIITDITERKLVEQKLRLQSEIVESMFEGVLLVRASDGAIVYANPRYEEMLGYGSGELVGKNVAIVNASTNGKKAEDVAREIQTNLEETGVWSGEVLNVKKDGTTVWCRAKASTLESPQYGKVWVSILEDVTEQKRAEEALRLSEAKHRAIVDNATDLIFLIGKKDEVIAINPAGARFLGKTVEQVLGKSLFDVYPKETAAMFSENVKTVLRTGKSMSIDEKLVLTGNDLWINTRLEPLLDDRNRPYAVTGVARNITERKQMEEELKRSEMTYRRLFEASQEGIAILDADTQRIIDANPYLQRLSGYSIQELRGKEFWDIESFKDLKRRIDFEELQKREAVRIEPLPIKVKEKGSIDVELVSTLYEVNGRKVIQCNVHDITERMRLQKELERHVNHLEGLVGERTRDLHAIAERLHYVIASNPAVIYTGKPVPDESDFLLTYLSERVVPMLGYTPEEFIGHPDFWERHVPSEDMQQVRAEMPCLWKEGQLTLEYRFLHKDGAYRWVREEAKVVRDVDGKPIEVNGYWTDVTERKRLEEELVASERLAAMGETTAMVGHDLRNPLQAIVSTIYLAKRELTNPPELSKEVAVKPDLVEMLETIQNEAYYMGKIVSDLQDYAAPLRAEPTPVQVEPLVKDTLSKIRIPQNVEVTCKVSEELHTAMIDPFILRRVFTNLIMNAVQSMPDGGELRIDLYGRDEFLFVAFKDTGVGISKENMGRLFSPFFTTKAKGEGLGLAVCKRLVEALDGRITVESKPGEGSTFTVRLAQVKP
jgi:PAS domain S-box-containing protein